MLRRSGQLRAQGRCRFHPSDRFLLHQTLHGGADPFQLDAHEVDNLIDAFDLLSGFFEVITERLGKLLVRCSFYIFDKDRVI